MILGPQFNRLFRVAILAAVVAVVHGPWQSSATANPIVITTPTGLQGGDQFRIIFVTPGTTDAKSSDISTYDTFVNQQAGLVTYNGQAVHFSAIGSTDSIGAKAHIGVTGAAVYMANGQHRTALLACGLAMPLSTTPVRTLMEMSTQVQFGPARAESVPNITQPFPALVMLPGV